MRWQQEAREATDALRHADAVKVQALESKLHALQVSAFLACLCTPWIMLGGWGLLLCRADDTCTQ